MPSQEQIWYQGFKDALKEQGYSLEVLADFGSQEPGSKNYIYIGASLDIEDGPSDKQIRILQALLSKGRLAISMDEQFYSGWESERTGLHQIFYNEKDGLGVNPYGSTGVELYNLGVFQAIVDHVNDKRGLESVQFEQIWDTKFDDMIDKEGEERPLPVAKEREKILFPEEEEEDEYAEGYVKPESRPAEEDTDFIETEDLHPPENLYSLENARDGVGYERKLVFQYLDENMRLHPLEFDKDALTGSVADKLKTYNSKSKVIDQIKSQRVFVQCPDDEVPHQLVIDENGKPRIGLPVTEVTPEMMGYFGDAMQRGSRKKNWERSQKKMIQEGIEYASTPVVQEPRVRNLEFEPLTHKEIRDLERASDFRTGWGAMEKLLDDADPMLMRSSKEFKAVQASIRALQEHRGDNLEETRRLMEQTVKAAEDYVKYKTDRNELTGIAGVRVEAVTAVKELMERQLETLDYDDRLEAREEMERDAFGEKHFGRVQRIHKAGALASEALLGDYTKKGTPQERVDNLTNLMVDAYFDPMRLGYSAKSAKQLLDSGTQGMQAMVIQLAQTDAFKKLQNMSSEDMAVFIGDNERSNGALVHQNLAKIMKEAHKNMQKQAGKSPQSVAQKQLQQAVKPVGRAK